MSAYTEQEELEKLKAWWKNYGGALIIGLLVGVGILVGNKYWTQYQEQMRQAAVVLYEDMLNQARSAQSESARASGAQLIEKYARTPYAGMAALFLAKISFEANDLASARKHLEWAVTHATDSAVKHSARLRLGRLLLEASEPASVLALFDVEHQEGFEAEYQELRGDALAMQGKTDDARKAYQAAIEQAAVDTPYRRVLVMKLDDLAASEARE